MKKIDILIFTAIPEEFQAVRAHLSSHQDHFLGRTGTYYEIGNYKEWRIGVTQTEAGNVKTATEVERGINEFKPKYVFFVGVAGGVKDVKIGDVVVGTKVYNYEIGKASKEYKPRLGFGQSNYFLEQRAKAVQAKNVWQSKIKATPYNANFGQPEVFVKPIAAGEKVIDSKRSEVFKLIQQNCSDALAVEMEGYGFLEAKRPHKQVEALLIRGVSDLINGKGNADKQGSQFVASSNVSAFAFAVIDTLQKEVLEEQKMTFKEFHNLICSLYPKGVTEGSVWKRSGGDLSILKLEATGKEQWWEALTKLKNGGGGDITFGTLFQTIKSDFQNNLSVQSFDLLDFQNNTNRETMNINAKGNKNIIIGSNIQARNIHIGDIINNNGQKKT